MESISLMRLSRISYISGTNRIATCKDREGYIVKCLLTRGWHRLNVLERDIKNLYPDHSN